MTSTINGESAIKAPQQQAVNIGLRDGKLKGGNGWLLAILGLIALPLAAGELPNPSGVAPSAPKPSQAPVAAKPKPKPKPKAEPKPKPKVQPETHSAQPPVALESKAEPEPTPEVLPLAALEPAVRLPPVPPPQALNPTLVPLNAGCAQLGSAEGDAERRYNERQHPVCVQAFVLGKYEVTLGEFRQFVTAAGYAVQPGCWAWNGTQWDNNPLYHWDNPGFPQTEEQPVVCVSWDDTQAYLAWLNRTTGQSFRLATEAEWEYAARAQTQTVRPWGDAPELACEYANGADRSSLQAFNWDPIHECSDGQIYTAPIGSYRANAWGLHDMLGNAAEWTCSEYDRNYGDAWALHCATAKTIATDPRVIRGGAWANVPDWVRSAQRVGKPPATRFNYVGFRLARDQ